MSMIRKLRNLSRHIPAYSLHTWFLLILVVTTVITVWTLQDEDIFIVLDGHPVTLAIIWERLTHRAPIRGPIWQEREAEFTGATRSPLMTSSSPNFPNGIPGIDHIYIVHFAPELERKALLERSLHSIGLRKKGYYEFRSEWDEHNILRPLNIISQHHFSSATEAAISQRIGVAGTLVSEHNHYSNGDDHLTYEPLSTALKIRMACWMQHWTGWTEMVAANYSSLLVLENDAVLVRGFGEKLAIAMQEVPKDYDLLFVGSCLGRHAPGYSPTLQKYSDTMWKAKIHRCASGYVLSRQGAEKLLRAPPMIGMDNIDEWMQFHMEREFTEVYWLEPILLYEGTKSFLLPVFCSPRTSIFGCDPFFRPLEPTCISKYHGTMDGITVQQTTDGTTTSNLTRLSRESDIDL